MKITVSEVMTFVKENDVKFIRLAFCDMFGNLKNVSIMPEELPRAFETGISFDASAVKGFLNAEESDLFLVPDPSTLSILPWRPSHGRVIRLFCDICRPGGRPFEGDMRQFLRTAAEQAQKLGYRPSIGSECEFYLFQTDENGDPTKRPHDHAGYCDVAPLDKGENVRREICLTLEEMGLQPESSHHEQGPGQNEIAFRYNGAVEAADDLITFKNVVKSIASRSGLFASFLPKPLPEASGSGLHVNLSLFREGKNIFRSGREEHCPEAESFLMGIFLKVPEMTAFLNPLTNSYRRFGVCEAPRYLTWSHQNRSQLIRIPAASGEYSRMELRSPDPACNPYLAFGLLILAGLSGIEEGAKLCPPTNRNLFTDPPVSGEGIVSLPGSLSEALSLAEKSEFIRSVLPEEPLRKFLAVKREECEAEKKWGDPLLYEDSVWFPVV